MNCDPDFFEKLSLDEAKALLSRFRELESSKIEEMRKQIAFEGFELNFSIQSVAPCIRWTSARLETFPREPDPRLPLWIRNTDSYRNNLFEFDEPSKSLTLRAAYYLGESFVRSHGNLRWGTGNLDYAYANMPVIAGFRSGHELAPAVVTDNLLREVVRDPSKLPEIESTIELWNSFV
jgi:hypothetical protein